MMTQKVSQWLMDRGLDLEVAIKLGWDAAKRGRGEALVIPTYRNDKVVARKYRLLDAESGQRWSNEGETCFWNEQVLFDEFLDGQPLIITEGHFDALAAIQCGFLRTVSVPNGAPAPKPDGAASDLDSDRYAFVRKVLPTLSKDRFPEIIIASDNDGPGEQLLHDLSVQLGRYRCKFLTYPKSRDDNGRLKDLNEVLQAYGQKGVVETINRSQWTKLNGVKLMSELPPLPPQKVYDIGFSLLSENYKIRLGDFTVVTGSPGFGKSTFVNDLCCRVSDLHSIKIAWASFEQAPQRDHKRALSSWYMERRYIELTYEDRDVCDKWIDDHHVFIYPDEDEDVTLDWLLDAMEGAVVRHGAQVVVIDPWNEIEHARKPGETETEYIAWAIRTLKRFAKKFQVHLILVAHPAKMQRVDGKYLMPSLYDISGSANFYNKCEIGIIVHKEDADNTIIKVQKSRYHEIIGKPGVVAMQFCADDRRYREVERVA